ncbi:MAG TPA: CBS domain-containing protein [Candidatus Norongarragalinales archaeon]|nr:CBS domain-containing protein [Candidatus Norongarragalinales archaeon]
MEGLIRSVETIDGEETLSKGLKRLADSEMLVVTRNGKYAGELRADMLLRFKADADVEKIRKVARKGSIVSERDAGKFGTLFEKFSKSGMRWLVVVSAMGKPVGMVHAQDLLRSVADSVKGQDVRECMEKVITVDAGTPSDKAEELMVKSNVRELAVFDGGKFAGVLTARDIAVKIKPYMRKKLHTIKPREMMDVEKEPVRSILTPEFEIRKAQLGMGIGEALRAADFEEAYIFEGQKLKGRLSYYKILKGLELVEPAHIEVSGLTSEENMFKESIFEECALLLRKFGKGGRIHLHIKSSRKGKEKKIFEIHGRLEIGKMSFVCTTPEIQGHKENWDLGMAVAEVLAELKKSYLKRKG